MHQRWLWLAVLSTFILCGGCGGSPAPEAPKPAPAHTAADLGPLCDRYYERQRVCVDAYTDRLLDVRLEYDMPPGIVAEVAAQGREAVLRGVRADWEPFTSLEATAKVCGAIAERTPADQVERLYRDGEHCLATPDCAAYAHCAVETERTYIQSGDQH